MQPIFITGIGTGIGKTVIAAVVTAALDADYWKPVQAGFAYGTDAGFVQDMLRDTNSIVHPEVYKLSLPASPHLSARQENIKIDLDLICTEFTKLQSNKQYITIEGAGGIMVPLNDDEFVIDLIKKMNGRVILVSRNYLGSINHSLLTASICKKYELDVAGWIFNDHFMNYEDEIVKWSGFKKIASVPGTGVVDRLFIKSCAADIRESLQAAL